MLSKMSNAQLQAIVDLTEARRLSISKDDLRMSENQLLWSDELEKEVLDYWDGLNAVWESRKMPPCTCADESKDGGFKGKRSKKGKIYNDYFHEETPCNIELYQEWKDNNAARQT